VLFTDFVGFTSISEKLTPKELVAEIHYCFTAFDTITERHGLEKIKTIGDAYLAVCGLPNADEQHAKKTVQAAIEIREFINKRFKDGGKFTIRIGINSGSVVAGIVGVKKFAYDIWGDTVNTATRMEQHSINGKINISEATYQLVKNDFTCTHRGKIEAKNKGKVDMYFVEKMYNAEQQR
jgi:class 3 adenylate cyclase